MTDPDAGLDSDSHVDSDLRRRQARYQRFSDWSQIPGMVLSLLLIPVVLMPLTEELSDRSIVTLEVIGVAIWAAFAVEYALLLILSVDRAETIRTHKLELFLVLVPFLRPLRLARVARFARAGTALAKATKAIARMARRPGFGSTIAAVSGSIVTGGFLVSVAEHDQDGATITGVADGIWWAFVTCTTVGYGDTYPVTASGRVIAIVLMLAGISGLSVITANIAAYFVSADAESSGHAGDGTGGNAGDDAEGIGGGTESIEARLDRIEEGLAHLIESLGDRSGGRAR